MKKNSILIASISVIAALILGLIITMFATGKFGDLLNEFKNEPTTAAQTETTTSVAPNTGRPKSAIPDSIVACEYTEYSEKSADNLSEFKKFGFNTVIFCLTKDNVDKVIPLFETAKINGLYFGVKADISVESDYLADFVKNNNFDFVIISGADESLSDYSEKMNGICKSIKETDSAMVIGIEPVLISRAHEPLTNPVSTGSADFIYLNHESGKADIFRNAQKIWNEETSPLWLCHDLSSLSSYTTDDATEIIDIISASADMSMCRGLSFRPFADISGANGTSADIVLSYILERKTYLLDKEFELTSHQKTNITVEQSKITFRGTSSPAHELKCNGKALTVAKNGDFSTDVELKAGDNTVTFEHKGKTYTYKVTYKIKLLKSVSPSETISVPGGMQVDVSAVANKNATLTVAFNGKTYKMTESVGDEEEYTPDESSDFRTFTATLETPAGTSSVQNLGQYKVTAKYNSLTESKLGASIKVSAVQIVTPPPATEPPTTTTTTTATQKPSDTSAENTETTSGGETTTWKSETNSPSSTLQKYYYTENYGLGSTKICEIIDDYVETYPGNNTKTYSVPDCSPLLKGTVDYVTSTVICDNDTYYVLASGVKVPELREEKLANGKDGKITHVSIKNGYVMPKNNINVVSSKTIGNETVIVLEMNRPVAFNVKLTGQTYLPYKDRLVAVSSLNCTGLEITFSDTATAQGDITLVDSVCKAAKWSADSGKSTATLSLTLAQKGKFYGYHYEYNNDGNLVITIKNKPSESLKGYTIMLDPGHGGIDGGATCAVTSTGFGVEKHINLSIATKVKELLEAEGADVLMTRTTDKWVCYADRNANVRNKTPDMFISIHCDASETASAMGTSAYYYRAYSQPLAKAIHEKLVKAYKTEIYKDSEQSVKDKVSRGANFYAFRVARVEECPAILIEYGFVTNTEECQVLQTAANRDILAAATVEGIKEYISKS